MGLKKKKKHIKKTISWPRPQESKRGVEAWEGKSIPPGSRGTNGKDGDKNRKSCVLASVGRRGKKTTPDRHRTRGSNARVVVEGMGHDPERGTERKNDSLNGAPGDVRGRTREISVEALNGRVRERKGPDGGT